MNSNDIPEDVRVVARKLFSEMAGYTRTDVTASALDDIAQGRMDDMPMLRIAMIATLAERDRCEAKCKELHNTYLTSAGWVKDEIRGWHLPRSGRHFDIESHNAFVSRANAAGACVAAIRGASHD